MEWFLAFSLSYIEVFRLDCRPALLIIPFLF